MAFVTHFHLYFYYNCSHHVMVIWLRSWCVVNMSIICALQRCHRNFLERQRTVAQLQSHNDPEHSTSVATITFSQSLRLCLFTGQLPCIILHSNFMPGKMWAVYFSSLFTFKPDNHHGNFLFSVWP